MGRQLDVRPPSSTAGGTVTEITSEDDSVTITNPEGPVVDLSVPGGSGTVTEITSEDDSVTITNPEGPVVDLSVAPGAGSLPGLSGDGNPTNSVTPDFVGQLYLDTSGGSGLWIATTDDDTGWAAVTIVGLQSAGGVLQLEGGGVALSAGPALDASITLVPAAPIAFTQNSLPANVFINAGTPVGSVTPSAEGDLCIDTSTPALWQSTGAGDDTLWEQLGAGALPAAFLTGSGSPVGSVTPGSRGYLYFDTDGDTGLWLSTSDTSADWASIGSFEGPGLEIFTVSAGVFALALEDSGGGGISVGNGGSSSEGILQIVSGGSAGAGGQANVMVHGGSPIGAIDPTLFSQGDLCIDIDTPGLWQIIDDFAPAWAQIGGLLPTADPAVKNSLWNNLGIVTVSAG